MKTMTRLIVAVGMFIGLMGTVHAASVFSTTYTAVQVFPASNTATNTGGLELLRVEWSSGSALAYLLLFDSASVYNTNVPGVKPGPLGPGFSAAGGYARWTPNQLAAPPISLSSSTYVGVGPMGIGSIDFTDDQGNGRDFNNGLVAFKEGTDIGTVITYVYRRRRTSPGH